MSTIGEQLQTYRSALTEAQTKGEQAIATKIEQQIRELEEFQQRHPEQADAPSPFEVFCDLNPSDINCRVYDD
ncbi:MAG: CP12 domain-containing protein [Cyanobacteriota bacterium]|jgi:arginine utilization protein RocB